MSDGNTQGGRTGPLIHLANNPISLIGVVLTTTGGVAWLFLLPAYLGGQEHPYLDLLTVLALPAVFFLGLLLIPLGIRIREKRERRTGAYPSFFPPVSWKSQAFRRLVIFAGAATFANIIIGAHLSYSAAEYMNSTSFCGESCHVMKPEFEAYKTSTHSQVDCVECHIGPGAGSYVAAKLNGVNQLVGMLTGGYSRPIPAPVHNLADGNVLCGRCHAAQTFAGDRLKVIGKFSEDEANTPAYTVLLMRIGGGSEGIGIHGAHLAPGVKIEYRSDPARSEIPWVRRTDASGKIVEYVTEEWAAAQQADYELRAMDCTDCHNRPAHPFDLPSRAVDRALSAAQIDRSLPNLKQKALEILTAEYASSEEAAASIPAKLSAFYESELPDVAAEKKAQIEQAGEVLSRIFARNVSPEMNISWGAYPNHIGHESFPGCFRCHDDTHSTPEGETISQDCGSCHEMVALEEEQPEVLNLLGVARTD
jgi:nitrate/TMAO reductase-like tetraheme cytochrome c subunit